MDVKIAWRNLYRRPQRTFLVLMGIGVSIFCLIFFLAMCKGMFVLMIDTIIDNTTGHLQVHQKDYLLKQEIDLNIENQQIIMEKIKSTEHVTGVSPRILVNGLVSTATSSGFAKIYGIDPEMESSVTVINKKLIKGKILEKDDERGVYIGKALAEKLKIDIDEKLVIMARDAEGEIGGGAFRVRGIYSAGSKDFEKLHVYITIKGAQEMLVLENQFHEIAIRLDKGKNLDAVAGVLKNKINNRELSVETWKDLSPVIAAQLDMAWIGYLIMFSITFISMAFGILNAFLMKIFERIKEYGIMMALGTGPSKIFSTILWESFLLGLTGSILGTVLSFFVIKILLRDYIDYSFLGGGMEFVGISNRVPLITVPTDVILCIAGTILVTVIASILPALRASGFKPVEALRFI